MDASPPRPECEWLAPPIRVCRHLQLSTPRGSPLLAEWLAPPIHVWSLLLAAHGGDPASPLHGVAKKARRAAAKASRKARKARKAARKDEL